MYTLLCNTHIPPSLYTMLSGIVVSGTPMWKTAPIGGIYIINYLGQHYCKRMGGGIEDNLKWGYTQVCRSQGSSCDTLWCPTNSSSHIHKWRWLWLLGLLESGISASQLGPFMNGFSSFLRNLSLLTGTVSQVLLMNRSLPDDWSYDRVMLQLLGTTGTVRRMWGLPKSAESRQGARMKHMNKVKLHYHCVMNMWLFKLNRDLHRLPIVLIASECWRKWHKIYMVR